MGRPLQLANSSGLNSPSYPHKTGWTNCKSQTLIIEVLLALWQRNFTSDAQRPEQQIRFNCDKAFDASNDFRNCRIKA